MLDYANLRGIADVDTILGKYLESCSEEPLWLVDDRVWFDGDWVDFQRSFDDSEADLLATEIRTYDEERTWPWWSSLFAPGDVSLHECGVAALLPLLRLSRSAAQAVLRGIQHGWKGHLEALLPSLVNHGRLKIEDIGGKGSFVPPKRLRLWYDERTWNWKGPVDYVPEKLHFPVHLQTTPLSVNRFDDGVDNYSSDELKLLYVSPVGSSMSNLLDKAIVCFQSGGADCKVLQYDDGSLTVPGGVEVINDRGYKFQLALRHLHPEEIAEYDYIFLWDDDIDMPGFDPVRFAHIMRANRLDMAQPAIKSLYGLSHAITKQCAVPAPRVCNDGGVRFVVGRLTNFVEIMVPVFSRSGWREFYSYLRSDNRSGWGYDYIPLARKGIVDAMPVVHTRQVQSICGASESELRDFLENQGLFRYASLELGWLFERGA